ncbi:MAG: hypothetical protein WB791_01270 [Waddliaceae bacterium]
MFRWMEMVKQSSRKTKVFVFTGIIYTLAVIFTTIYAYLSLTFVDRDQDKAKTTNTYQQTN